MIRQLALVLAATFLAIPGGSVRAQQPATPAAPAPAAPAAPAKEAALLKVQVVISRYQGEKKISSQPYTLSVTANGARANLRMGLQVAVPSNPTDSAAGKSAVSFVYRDVGTSIDCGARALDDGRYRLELSIDDSSIASGDQGVSPLGKEVPQFRSFRILNETAVLRDGQSAQLTTATEKVTGEVAKVDVTLNVVK